MRTHTSTDPSSKWNPGWGVVTLLFLGSVINYVDRSVLGVVKPQIQCDLGLSNVQYGWAVNGFLATYTIFYILGGRLADWWGYRRMFTVNVLFWSAACSLHAWTRGLAGLVFFRGLLGAGEGGFYPAAMRGAAEWFGPENRAKAVGILLCGLSVGTVITPPVVGAITGRWGWRAGFLFAGLIGFLLVPPWLWLHRRIRNAPRSTVPNRDLQESTVPIRRVLAHRKYLGFLLARAVTDAVWTFYLFWMPGYFQEVRGFDLAAVVRLLWIPFFAADLGALAGAWASSGLVRSGWSVDHSRKLLLLVSAAMGTLGMLVPLAGHSMVALALVSLVLFGQLSWSSNIHTTITEIAPKAHVAILYGITGAAGNGLGAVAQPLIGHAVDTWGYSPVFVAAGMTYVVAVCFVLAAGRIEPIERKTP